MRFSTTVADLHGCVATAAAVTPRTADRPGNAGVLFDAGAHGVRVVGTDGDTTVTARLYVDASDGSTLVAPGPLLAYLASVDGAAPVSVAKLATDELEVAVTGRATYRFRPISATFTRPPASLPTARPVRLGQLPSALRPVAAAVHRDHGGVQVVSDGTAMTFTATDNYRLAHARIPDAGFDPFLGVVSLSVLELAAKIRPVAMAADAKGTLVSFDGPAATVTTRLLGVAFPPVERLLDAVPATGVTLPVAELRAALRPLRAVAADRPLKVTVDGDTVSVSASNLEVGSGTETVVCPEPASGPTFTFAVSADFLNDVLTAAEAPTLRLSWTTPDAALYFTAAAPLPVTSIVMPQTM